MSCKDCIYDRTRVFFSDRCFDCKGVGYIVYAFELKNGCKYFEHKDYPQKIEI